MYSLSFQTHLFHCIYKLEDVLFHYLLTPFRGILAQWITKMYLLHINNNFWVKIHLIIMVA